MLSKFLLFLLVYKVYVLESPRHHLRMSTFLLYSVLVKFNSDFLQPTSRISKLERPQTGSRLKQGPSLGGARTSQLQKPTNNLNDLRKRFQSIKERQNKKWKFSPPDSQQARRLMVHLFEGFLDKFLFFYFHAWLLCSLLVFQRDCLYSIYFYFCCLYVCYQSFIKCWAKLI